MEDCAGQPVVFMLSFQPCADAADGYFISSFCVRRRFGERSTSGVAIKDSLGPLSRLHS